MALIARAAKGTRNKNLLIIVMCAVTLGLFIYDGWFGYPAGNDRLIAGLIAKAEDPKGGVDPSFESEIKGWSAKHWSTASTEEQKRMDEIITSSKNVFSPEGWKSPLDILIQKLIVALLVVATAAALWRFVRYQKRRVVADDGTISPAPGLVIPWEKISLVDNTRWQKMEIVQLTYTDGAGKASTVEVDGYYLEREPLLAILDQLAEKAVNAEFIPKEEEGAGESPATP